jgi:diguanylate cyclase (GGDEF)-like protein/PAS domain S-box-containing protein
MTEKEFDSQELFEAFMSHSPSVAFMKDTKGRYVYVNKRWEHLFSLTLAEVKGKSDFDWMPEEKARQLSEIDKKVFASAQSVEMTETLPAADGRLIYWTVTKFPFIDAKGQKFVGGVAIDITEQTETEEKLRQSEREIRTLIENSPEIIVRFDADLRHVYANPALARATGFPVEDFIGKQITEIGFPKEMSDLWQSKLRQVLESGAELIFESQFRGKNGLHYYHSRMTPEFDGGKRPHSILVMTLDITKQKEFEEKLKRSEQHYRLLIENSQGFICTHDRWGNLLSVNPAAAQSLGYEPDDLIGRNMSEFMPPKYRDYFYRQLELAWLNTTDNGLMVLLTRDGRERIWKYHNVKLTETVEEPFILGFAQDVTDMQEIQKQLKSLTLADDLTGLYNRRGFLTLAERQLKIARSRPNEKDVYLLFADMDGLKQINDRFGHEQGSLAITKMSEILAANFRASDIIARLGGDEFVALLTDADDATQEIILNRLQKKIADYNAQKNHPFDLALSVGITKVDMVIKNLSIEELLASADKAMYEQKRRKKSQAS